MKRQTVQKSLVQVLSEMESSFPRVNQIHKYYSTMLTFVVSKQQLYWWLPLATITSIAILPTSIPKHCHSHLHCYLLHSKWWIQIMSFKQNWTSVERCFHSGHMLVLHYAAPAGGRWSSWPVQQCSPLLLPLRIHSSPPSSSGHIQRGLGQSPSFQRGISPQTNCGTWDYGTALRNMMWWGKYLWSTLTMHGMSQDK